jgi:hypothetical protein
MTNPHLGRQAAVDNATALIRSYCGRRPDGTLLSCEHDHSAEGDAFVRTVEQFAFPELLNGLLYDAEHNPDLSLEDVVSDKAAELEHRATNIEPR